MSDNLAAHLEQAAAAEQRLHDTRRRIAAVALTAAAAGQLANPADAADWVDLDGLLVNDDGSTDPRQVALTIERLRAEHGELVWNSAAAVAAMNPAAAAKVATLRAGGDAVHSKTRPPPVPPAPLSADQLNAEVKRRLAAAGYQPAGYRPAEADRAAVRARDPALADEVERHLARIAASVRPGWLDQ